MKIEILLIKIVITFEINDIYVDDPKKSFKSDWESMGLILSDNREWKNEYKTDNKIIAKNTIQ